MLAASREASRMIEAYLEPCTQDVRVLVACDVRLYREGLEQLLRGVTGIDVLTGATGATETIERARALAPAVVLLDMAMPDAFSIVRNVVRDLKTTKVVALGMPEVQSEIITCAAAGVVGYVPRAGSLNDAVEAIRAVANGEVHCSPKAAGFLFRHIAASSVEATDGAADGGLTTRERQIMRLLQQGLTNKAISRNLGIEQATVKNHLHRIFSKLGVHRRTEAVSLLQRKP